MASAMAVSLSFTAAILVPYSDGFDMSTNMIFSWTSLQKFPAVFADLPRVEDRVVTKSAGVLIIGAHKHHVGAGASSKACVNVPAAAAMRGSRLGKALKAMQLGSEALPPKASFQDSCGCLLRPFESAKDAPAWKAPALLRTSPSGGPLSISPYLAKQREARNLQNTWDDLLARQALEASAAEHLAEWAKEHLPTMPAARPDAQH